MAICKCGRLITHSQYSRVCERCKISSTVYKKFAPVSNDKPGINKGKETYTDYNPAYKKEDLSISPQNRGKKKYQPKVNQALTDRLNKLLKRNI